MAVAEIRVKANSDDVKRLEKWALTAHTDVASFLSRVVSALANEAWASLPIGPSTQQATGVAGPLPKKSDQELLADSLVDRFEK